MRLNGMSAQDSSGETLLHYDYTHDSSSNILTKETEHGNYCYGDDKVSRLTGASNPEPLDDEAYSYDGVGNRLSASGVSGDIEHNANNELELYGDISFEYDANGSLTAKSSASESWAYSYNVRNRLVRVEEDGLLIAEYGYDPFGRRLWKEVDGTRTYFLYSDEGLVAEYDEEGNELRSYGWKPGSTWGTDPLWLKENGKYYWYQNDHLGTPQKLVDSSGTVVWSVTYSAFGEAQITVETVTNNLRFPGQYFDAETGLHYNALRYYDSDIGRYTQTDPIGFHGGDANLYGYVRNTPVNALDPRGLIQLAGCPPPSLAQCAMKGVAAEDCTLWSNCLGGAVSNRVDRCLVPVPVEHMSLNPDIQDDTFIDAMKSGGGWSCSIKQHVDDCQCNCDENKILMTPMNTLCSSEAQQSYPTECARNLENYQNSGYGPSSPWLVPDWEFGKPLTEFHAIRALNGCSHEYKQIPELQPYPQQFNRDIKWELFKNKPLLCCCKSGS